MFFLEKCFKQLSFIFLFCLCSLVYGEPLYIVHHKSPDEARELAEHLFSALNRRCRIIDEKDFSGNKPAFYVGPTRFAQKHGLSEKSFEPDGWAYKSIGSNVVLLGHSHEGTGNAVYNFLENELGVRWYTFESVFIPTG